MRYPVNLIPLATLAALLIPTVAVAASQRLPLPLAQAIAPDTRQAEAARLLRQGVDQYNVSAFQDALESWQQALALYRELNATAAASPALRTREAMTLGNIGVIYKTLGNYSEALTHYDLSLSAYRAIGDREGEAGALNNIGNVYRLQGNAAAALDYLEQSLALAREVGDRSTAADALANIGLLYRLQGNYPEALRYFEEGLALIRELGERNQQASTLNSIGNVYALLGNYPEALNYFEQSLALAQELGDRNSAAYVLSDMGVVYAEMGNETAALPYHQRSLALFQELGNRSGAAINLNNMGLLYSSLGNYAEALVYYEQSLALAQELGERESEAANLNNIGLLYNSLGNYADALTYYDQSLSLKRELGDRVGEANTLSNIGKLFRAQDQSELAIIFLKASVDVRESIRVDNRSLDLALQESYTDTVAADYRFLADLLLEAGRIPEAQQVLDLLQLEELREFTTTTRAVWSGETLQYTAIEQPVIEAHGSLIALGQKIYECRQTRCADLTDLRAQQRTLTTAYEAQVAEFETVIAQGDRDDSQFQDPRALSDGAYDLLQANPDALLIYPFVTEEKLWLLWASAGGAVGSIAVEEATQGELSRVVQQFGEQLQSPGDLAALQATSYQLYQWLIQPLAAELDKNTIQQLIFVNDRVTRYIPMAALFDGEHYLGERYTISTVITPGTTDTSQTLAQVNEATALAVGLSQAVGDFSPLPAVDAELDAVVRSDRDDAIGIYPGQVFLNEAFTLEAIQTNVEFKQILHIASHAEFAPSRPEDSFIVLGNNQKLRFPDLETMQESLRDLHLVVLSACQTALGGTAGDGTEIAGISSYFLAENRAETVIASLWSVNDTSTSLLMQRFYELLATGELTKAEALRQAQLSLLYDEDSQTRLAATRAGAPPTQREGAGRATATPGYRHPYYWAPFILIGNNR